MGGRPNRLAQVRGMQTTQAAEPTTSSSGSLRILLGVAVLGALAFAAYTLPVRSSLQTFLGWIQQVGVWGMVLFVAAYIGATVALVPGSLLTMGAGYAFGVLWGTILVSIASTVGAALSFLIGRYLARDWVREKIQDWPKFHAFDNALGEESFKAVFLLRLVPLLPFSAINYGFGASKVSFPRYFFASWTGMLPATIMYVYFGSLAEKATRLAAATPEHQIPVWAIAETARQLAAGNFGNGALQNAVYWLGLVAVVSVSWVITRKAKAELDRLTQRSEGQSPEAVTDAIEAADAAHESPPDIDPDDEHNRQLRDYTHPPSWTNPTPDETYNFVAIGGGTAGLVGAAGAAGLGAKSALIEREWLGGDCLVSGCVPSKTLIRSARAAAEVRRAGEFGIDIDGDVSVDFQRVMERVRAVRAGIAEEDSAERFSDLGVDIYLGHGSFVDDQTIEVDGRHIEFRKALVATGGSPLVPPIDGLEEVDYLTNETVFSLTERPDRMAIVGGGPIGCELAQAFQRFGTEVTVLEMSDQILPREDADAAAIVGAALREEGVDLRPGEQVVGASDSDGEIRLQLEGDDDSGTLSTDALLLAAGRSPNVGGLGLERAGIDYDDRSGILVDDRLQTSNRHVYSAGDVSSRYEFTHVADAQARIVLQNALAFGRARASDLVIPWSTYTEPEIAHVGLYPEQARQRGLDVETIEQDLSEVHRAVIEGADDGFLKVHLEAGTDSILGATMVADGAGDLITELTVAMNEDLGLASISDTIHPYPTTSAAFRRAADTYNRSRLKPWMESILETWFRWTR